MSEAEYVSYLHLGLPSIDTARELAPPTSPACHTFRTLPNTNTNANANTMNIIVRLIKNGF